MGLKMGRDYKQPWQSHGRVVKGQQEGRCGGGNGRGRGTTGTEEEEQTGVSSGEQGVTGDPSFARSMDRLGGYWGHSLWAEKHPP